MFPVKTLISTEEGRTLVEVRDRTHHMPSGECARVAIPKHTFELDC
jgi:hypothetical protein